MNRRGVRNILEFVSASFRTVSRGNATYALWMLFLLVLIAQGLHAYVQQFREGLILTHMRDSVSWGFYIGNFTFLVGVAAAAVMLVIPAYVYHWKPLKEVVLFGEFLAIAAIIMCLLFVLVDMGHPERLWHMIPGIGVINLPSSLLGWDAAVLNGYFLLNLVVATYIVYCAYRRRPTHARFLNVLIIASIPAAISIHTVTAFLYNGMASRPFWNSAILVPRFLASAFCSGPAILLILFQVLRKTTRFEIRDEALHKIAELMAYAMGINLLLFAAEIFKEYYSNTEHLVHLQYLFFGLHGEPSPIAPYAWMSVFMGIIAFFLFLVPRTRRNFLTLNIGCLLTYASVYIEKGMALIIPGYTPDVLGQIVDYFPSVIEIRVALGIFGIGFLFFTLMVKVGTAILFGNLYAAGEAATTPSPAGAGELRQPETAAP